jgi:hypothetical protein
MTRSRPLRRLGRPFARGIFLAATLASSAGLTATPAFAQNEPAAGEEKAEGRPLDGYLATGCLVGLALFLIAKSARR